MANVPLSIVKCQTQEQLEELIVTNKKVVVLYYSHAMPGGKAAEDKMHECARELEESGIRIPFVLVNYADFTEDGSKVLPPTKFQIITYFDGNQHASTSDSDELQRIVDFDGLL
ncbi:hypothetical protein BGZ65_011590 [Modicella reniformis]|uniref:Thioredoxin domain-containing protein n=1 Tax=Modicella reniformis TaxID=1440133 RepID=A0A9P6MAL0_9FUNG|nr:hypothetical protein BGZ65_011590 [Modicella reniformis]